MKTLLCQAQDNAREKAVYMHVASGRKYYPFAPKAEDICIEDIAHHLATAARWNGATVHPDNPDLISYSVAEHSVLVADHVEFEQERPDLALEALLHDAVETYLSDLIRPLKYSPTFREPFQRIEIRNEVVLAGKFGLQYPWPKEVKIADEAVCTLEQQTIVPRDPSLEWQSGVCHDDSRIANAKIRMLLPAQARDLFLARYEGLMSRRMAA